MTTGQIQGTCCMCYIMCCMFLMGTDSVGSCESKKLDKQSNGSYNSDYVIIYIQ